MQAVFNFPIKRVHNAVRAEHSKADDKLAVSGNKGSIVATGVGQHQPPGHV